MTTPENVPVEVASEMQAEAAPITQVEEIKASTNVLDAELASKILKQVEFYFGDANLPRDKFLQEKIKEKEGWVDLSVLASFSRMKVLSEDVSVIAEALEKSAELLELNEEKTAVRRKTELPESHETLVSSVYVKGFSKETTLDQLESFFAGVSEKVQAIRMRRFPDTKDFKGSVFVEVGSAEEANRVAALQLTFQDAPLTIMTKVKYFEGKNAERLEKKNDGKAAEKEEKPFEYTKGCLLYIDAVPEEITHNQIKEVLTAKQFVAYTNIVSGLATIRFKEPVTDEFAASVAEIEVAGQTLKCRRSTEEEEVAYYEQFQKELQEAMARKRGNNRGRGRGGKRQRRN